MSVRRRWSIVLPLLALALFLLGAYDGLRITREIYRNGPARYLYWGSVRLDSDPHSRHAVPRTVGSAESMQEADFESQPGYILMEPGVIEKAFVLSALPAFAASAGLLALLTREGLSQVATFYVTTPLLIVCWFYFLGRLIDRWRERWAIAHSMNVESVRSRTDQDMPRA